MIDRDELIKDLAIVQAEIDDDYLAYEDDDEPGIQYTLACNDDQSEYDRQTGDNSYTGSAYMYPHWAVTGIYRDSDLAGIADDLLDQLANLMPEVTV